MKTRKLIDRVTQHNCFCLSLAIVLAGCETATVVRGRTFGTDNGDLAGATLIATDELYVVPRNTQILSGVKYHSGGRGERITDLNGNFELTRIVSVVAVLFGFGETSTTFEAPGYRPLSVVGRHGEIIRAVLLRDEQSEKD